MNVSEAFTICMQNMHKRNLEKNYQQKTIEQRLTNFQGARRKTRDTFMLQRRNIDVENMSPIMTPQVTKKKAATEKTQKDTAKPANSNKRLEMLKKWKEEKEKMKKEAKKKAKPIFKVCHVSHVVASADLEKVNKEIKGKPIKKETSMAKSSWAPLNHKFRPPKNIQPIEVHSAPKAGPSSTATSSRKNPLKPKASPIRRVTRAQSSKLEDKQKPTLDQRKKQQEVTAKNPGRKNGKIEQPEAKAKKVDKEDSKPSKKNVGWDVVDMTESDDDVLIPKSRSKKRYAKTPIKRRKAVASVSADEAEDCFKTPPRHVTNALPKASSKKKHAKHNEEESSQRSNIVTIYSDEEVSLKTPRRSGPSDPSPAYISPFVTISRGKERARREFRSRQSNGGAFPTPDRGVADATSPKRGAEYFAWLLDREVERLESICAGWEKYRDENELSEEAQTLIFVPIGQSRLLVSKKFQQFRGLIEKCRRSEREDDKPITCADLHGFWDMVYMQVVDLNKRFDYLEKVKQNGWQEVAPEKETVVAKRPRGRPKKAGPPSRLRDFIKAARSRKGGERVDAEPAGEQPPTPPAQPTPPAPPAQPARPSTARRSLRASLLCGKTPKRPSTSPCLAIMKISRAIKAGDGVTPSKSILKTERARAEGAAVKSVLFKDEVGRGAEENVEADLIGFSPVVGAARRRSTRLSRVDS